MPNLNLFRFYPFLASDIPRPELKDGRPVAVGYESERVDLLYGGEDCRGAREERILQVARAIRCGYIGQRSRLKWRKAS